MHRRTSLWRHSIVLCRSAFCHVASRVVHCVRRRVTRPAPGLDTPSSFHAQYCRLQACRDCGGLRYYSSSRHTIGSPDRRPPRAARSGAPSNAPSTSGAPASPGPSHLSSDPRVNTARALVQRNRFAEALEDPAATRRVRSILTRRTFGFCWVWPPAGGPKTRGYRRMKQREAPLETRPLQPSGLS